MCRAMQENFEEGIMVGQEKTAVNLLRKGWLSFDEIADVSDLPIERVMELKGELETEARGTRERRDSRP